MMKNITISTQIRRKISVRILVCLLILFSTLVVITGYDISRTFVSVSKRLTLFKDEISAFIISQSLINNEASIPKKLKEMSDLNNIYIRWNKDLHKIVQNQVKWVFPLDLEYQFSVIGIDGNTFGLVVINGSLINNSDILYELFVRSLLFLLSLCITFFLLYPLVKGIPEEIFIKPILDLLDLLKSDVNKSVKIDNDKSPIEIIEIKETILSILESTKTITQQIAINKMAAQVAHDIRSPLAAISIAIHDVSEIPEKRRLMIKSAARRISDIANNLLLQSRADALNVNRTQEQEIAAPELLFVTLENIVSEKKYEYKKKAVQIQSKITDSAYSCFSNIYLPSFKRVLSNLINNSVEATAFSGVVMIGLACDDKYIEITVEDNGCGIPQDIIHKTTEQGFSYQKKTGTGFGLSYAKHQIELLGGDLFIHSEVNIGTKVIIKLSRAEMPNWFCETIAIRNQSKIIVLDDDPSIHDVWSEKMNSSNVKIIHLSKGSALTKKIIETEDANLYLVDYELLGSDRNGLDIIEEYNLNSKSILVSSCFEDDIIRKRCKTLGVRIIPKLYVPYISITYIYDSSKSSNG